MYKGKMMTYGQSRRGLSAYDEKRWVFPDGVHTEPVEYGVESVG